MRERESEFALLRDPRLAAHATSAMPAWLWSADGCKILWANAVGAAVFGASTATKAAATGFDAGSAATAQIERLATSLPHGGQTRLERLRGFGAGLARMLICACSRIALADKTAAILVVATEPAGPSLSLAERVRRLVTDVEAPVAVFAADGALLHATASAQPRLAGAATLAALGIEALAADALASGHAATDSITIDRIGSQAATALVVGFAARSETGPATDPQTHPATKPSETMQVEPIQVEPIQVEPIQVEPIQVEPTQVEPTQVEPIQVEPIQIEPALAVPPIAAEEPAATIATPPAPQAPPIAAPQHADAEAPASERRHPLRFVWQMDTDRHFVIGSDEFIELMGPRTTAAFGRSWNDIAGALGLDPDGQVERALATHETWSGVTVSWPVDGTNEKLPVEMSGLPVFDRDRTFRGYRGFGVCRDLDRINELTRTRRTRPLGFVAAPEPAPTPEPSTIAQPPDAQRGAQAEQTPLIVAAQTANVLPFRPTPAAEPKTPTLSPVERRAFRELAQELTARLKRDTAGEPQAAAEAIATGVAAPTPQPAAEAASATAQTATTISPPTAPIADNEPAAIADALAPAPPLDQAAPQTQPLKPEPADQLVLDRVPIGVLVYRRDTLLYANRAFLEWTGYDSLAALADAGGLGSLFVDPAANPPVASAAGAPLSIATHRGDRLPVEGRLFSVPWNGEPALALIVASGQSDDKYKAAELALRSAQTDTRELESILNIATDGVVVLAGDGTILAANRSAEVLFGRNASELDGHAFGELFAPDSERAARDCFDRIAGGKSAPGGGLDVTGCTRDGRHIPLSLSIGRLSSGDKFCAVLRDITQWKKTEEELRTAKRDAQKAAAAKADFLAKVSHEIRTPLNAMTGFAEVMMAERFGPIGNERYRTYLKDIHAAGNHLVSLLNDLLDLSKIEAGKLDLSFANVNLNELTQQCVAIMQPQANKERIIIRSSLTHGLPQVVADARSVRQIVLNLLSNSVKFTGPGGQVIVSTALSDGGEAVLRVRDTGIGMTEKDIDAALEPFRQIATSGTWGSGGTGLGLPLTKALAEANRASFSIRSAPNAGTLVEVAFPPTRVPA